VKIWARELVRATQSLVRSSLFNRRSDFSLALIVLSGLGISLAFQKQIAQTIESLLHSSNKLPICYWMKLHQQTAQKIALIVSSNYVVMVIQ